MPIVDAEGRECALVILEREFLRIYPVFVRRMEFFSYKQESGQSWSDFSANLESIGNQAQLEKIGTDELYVLRILTAITDDDLRKEFLRTEVDERTHTLLKDLGQRLETARATKKCLTAQSKGPNASQEDPARRPQDFHRPISPQEDNRRTRTRAPRRPVSSRGPQASSNNSSQPLLASAAPCAVFALRRIRLRSTRRTAPAGKTGNARTVAVPATGL